MNSLRLVKQSNELTEIGETIQETGGSIKKTADGIRNLRDLPLVGSEVKKSADGLDSTGDKIQKLGTQTNDSLGLLANTAFILIALLPTVPLWLLYYLADRKRDRLQGLFELRGAEISCQKWLAHRAAFRAHTKIFSKLLKPRGRIWMREGIMISRVLKLREWG